ncbi:glutamate synthase subunit beta [Sutterella sp.]|uniref:glutamate synthase subunit beta n=1 Tax=Sutterella sp. TaxID=1981025 RepID=UPI0026DEE3E1|nr:glutamate synthase subunit beta [Sutterella sp.]MDO5532029.1 glutamate synthase subunit beta [Sutterella sp.]
MGLDRGFLEFDRIEPKHEPVEVRLKHFREFISTLTDEEVYRQSARCMDCGIPFCSHSCPLHNQMPDYNQYVTEGDLDRAWEVLNSTHSFPEITGRICPGLCEEGCTLGIHRKAVGIKSIEKKLAEHAFAHGLVQPVIAKQKTGCRVAVVGSGPSGLAAAQQLCRAGHTVTVYEKMDKAGGLLRYGIPDFKLCKEVLDRRLDQLLREGVHFVLSTRITGEGDLENGVHDDSVRQIPISRLTAENDAVVLALGSEVPRDLPLPGRELPGIYFALDFLIAQNRANAGGVANPIDVKGKNVIVIGGGETASDCIGTANRLGAKSVTQLDYHHELPEVADLMREWPNWRRIKRTSTSQEEGCVRCFSTSTTAFEGDGRLERVKTVKVKWGPNRKITPVKGTEQEFPADVVLIAMGYAHPTHTLVKTLGLATDRRGSLTTEVEGPAAWRTAREGVFAAGDGRSGQSLVVNAISEGRRCAEAVNAWLVQKRSCAAPLWR